MYHIRRSNSFLHWSSLLINMPFLIEAFENELYRQRWLVPYRKVSTASNHRNLEPGKAVCEGMAWKRNLVLATPSDRNRAEIGGSRAHLWRDGCQVQQYILEV